jgi:hypothetical protein
VVVLVKEWFMRRLLVAASAVVAFGGAGLTAVIASPAAAAPAGSAATHSVAMNAAPQAGGSKTCPSPSPNHGGNPACGIDHNFPPPPCSSSNGQSSQHNPNCPSPSPSPTTTPPPCGFDNAPTGAVSGVLAQVAEGVGNNPAGQLVMQVACGVAGLGL